HPAPAPPSLFPYTTLFRSIFSVNLLQSRSGRALMAIRDNEIAASAMGVDVALYKTLAFGVSAGITGIAGGLGAIAVQFVAPDARSEEHTSELQSQSNLVCR